MAQAMTATVRAVAREGRRAIPRRAALAMTDAAAERIRELLASNPNAKALRIGVRTKGCSGMSYFLEHALERRKLEEEVNQDGAVIFIDPKAQMSLLGTEMDYVKTKLSSEFVFSNPNIKGTCGCGQSFTL